MIYHCPDNFRCSNMCCGYEKLLQISFVSRDLSQNLIKTLPSTFFKGAIRLTVVQLSYNAIESLPANVFHDLISLEELDLSQNVLTSIQYGTFSGMYSLKRLKLQSNRINQLPPGEWSETLFAGSSLNWG